MLSSDVANIIIDISKHFIILKEEIYKGYLVLMLQITGYRV
jgi:hypothetical protein